MSSTQRNELESEKTGPVQGKLRDLRMPVLGARGMQEREESK